MRGVLAIVLLALAPGFAHAGKIVIVTDEPGAVTASRFHDLLKATCPFAQMRDLVVDIKAVSTEQLGSCQGYPNSPRVVHCADAIQRYARETNADRVVVLKNSREHGGAGDPGNLGASATTGAGERTALHELMHSFGFKDEYEYGSALEANVYCNHNFSGENIAYFPDHPPYYNDADARARHSRDIPWLGRIKQATPIVSGSNLGTPIPKQIGLYPSSSCAKATTTHKAWRPGDDEAPNIMKDLNGGIPQMFYDSIYKGLRETPPPNTAQCEAEMAARNKPIVNSPPAPARGTNRGQRGAR